MTQDSINGALELHSGILVGDIMDWIYCPVILLVRIWRLEFRFSSQEGPREQFMLFRIRVRP